MQQAILAMTGGEPLDAVIDGAGGDSLNVYIRVLSVGGIIAMYGATAGPCKNLNVTSLFLKNGELRGSTMGSPRDFARMLEMVNKHRIVPIVDAVFPMEGAMAAFSRMRNAEQFGKLVIRTSSNTKL